MNILETNRIILKELRLDNTDELFRILSDEETMQYYPKPYTREETAAWITRSMRSYQEHGYGLWSMYVKANNQFIGQCGISRQDIDSSIVPEIGYHVHKTYWNNGYATEAAGACLRYGFENLNLHEIFIHTYVKNIPSTRIAEKIGMIRRKEYDKVMRQSGIIMKHVVFSLKKEEHS